MHIELVDSLHPMRGKVERTTQHVYASAYDAHIPTFPDQLLCLLDETDDVLCSVGLRQSKEGFYCEHYLNLPLEDMIFASCGKVVKPEQIMEVTNLASSSGKHMLRLLFMVIERCLDLKMECAVFTATTRLRKALKLLHLPFEELANADSQAVGVNHSWGRYYDTLPSVCVVHRESLLRSFYLISRKGYSHGA